MATRLSATANAAATLAAAEAAATQTVRFIKRRHRNRDKAPHKQVDRQPAEEETERERDKQRQRQEAVVEAARSASQLLLSWWRQLWLVWPAEWLTVKMQSWPFWRLKPKHILTHTNTHSDTHTRTTRSIHLWDRVKITMKTYVQQSCGSATDWEKRKFLQEALRDLGDALEHTYWARRAIKHQMWAV